MKYFIDIDEKYKVYILDKIEAVIHTKDSYPHDNTRKRGPKNILNKSNDIQGGD